MAAMRNAVARCNISVKGGENVNVQMVCGARPDLPPLAIEAGFRRVEKEYRAEQDQRNLLALSGIEAPAMIRTRKPRVGNTSGTRAE